MVQDKWQQRARGKPDGAPHPRGPVKPKTPRDASPKAYEGDRIAKIMARAGLCSRRDAEVWIAQGRVAVNGAVLTSPAIAVKPTDEISVDGRPLAQRERTRLFLFHKPRGLVTTNRDPEGRATVFDYLKDHHRDLPRLVSVGRLDINTEGLLLLTNDGGLARVLELPTTGWLRRYRVRANGEADPAALERLADGVSIDGIHYAGIEAALDRTQGANNWLTIGLREGKNREIKRVLEHLGLVVNRLIRLSFGPFQLGELADGAIEEVRTRVLRDQLGPALAEAAGVDFQSAIGEPAPPPRPERPPRAGGPRAHRDKPRSEALRANRDKPRSEPVRTNRDRPRSEALRANRARPEAEPEPQKPRERPKAGPRKHFSVLRAEAAAEGRRRSVQSETADRKGRSVTVERRIAVIEPASKRVGKPGAPKRKPAADERRTHKTFAARPDRHRDGDVARPRRPDRPRKGPPRGKK
jgi:23S rRNA pseudouridine2605 synthase